MCPRPPNVDENATTAHGFVTFVAHCDEPDTDIHFRRMATRSPHDRFSRRWSAPSLRVLRSSFLLVPLLFTACPVDDRVLTPNDGSAGDPSLGGSVGGPSAGSGAGANLAAPPNAAGSDNAGDGGQPSSGPALVDGCPDLDADSVSDCTETAVKNFAFDADVSPWVAETGAKIAWSAQDLLAQAGSGSALITSSDVLDAGGNSFVSADQCIPVREGQLIDIFVNAYIDRGQIAGQAAISLWFFSDVSCPESDSVLDSFETESALTPATLLVLHGTKSVAPGALSARVRLGVSKPFQAASFSVHFDNVLVHVH